MRVRMRARHGLQARVCDVCFNKQRWRERDMRAGPAAPAAAEPGGGIAAAAADAAAAAHDEGLAVSAAATSKGGLVARSAALRQAAEDEFRRDLEVRASARAYSRVPKKGRERASVLESTQERPRVREAL